MCHTEHRTSTAFNRAGVVPYMQVLFTAPTTPALPPKPSAFAAPNHLITSERDKRSPLFLDLGSVDAANDAPRRHRYPQLGNPSDYFSEVLDGERYLVEACGGDDSFTVTSTAVKDAVGCYVAAEGTSFGEGFLYAGEDTGDNHAVYPKLLTASSESNVRTLFFA